MDAIQKDGLNILGAVLVIAGVAVWAVYAVVHWGVGWEVEARQFLPYHLAGVIPGMLLRRRKFFHRQLKRLLGQAGE